MCLSAGNFSGVAAGQDEMSALAADQCFNVAYELRKDELYVGAIWLGVAIPIGLIVGALFSALIFRCCCKQWWKQEEALLRNDASGSSPQDAVHQHANGCCLPFPRSSPSAERPVDQNRQSRSAQFAYRRISAAVESVVSEQELQPSQAPPQQQFDEALDSDMAMADILARDTAVEAEMELVSQDERFAEQLESDLLAKRDQISQTLLTNELHQLSVGSNADKRVIEKVKRAMVNTLKKNQDVIEENARQQLLAAHQGDKDALQSEIERIRQEARQNTHNNFKRSLDQLRVILKETTKLSDAQIDDLMEKLGRNLADLERVLNDYVELQIEHILNRSAARKAHLEQQSAHEKATSTETSGSVDAAEKMLQQAALTDDERREILDGFRQALKEIRRQHRTSVKEQTKKIAEQMRQQRASRLKSMQERHAKQMEELLLSSKSMDAQTLLDAVHQLMDDQADEIARLWKELDSDEAAKISNLYLKLDQTWKAKVKEATAKLLSALDGKEPNSSNAKALKRQLELEIAENEKRLDTERQMNQTELSKRSAERKKGVQAELNRNDVANEKLADAQHETLRLILDNHPNFDEHDHQHILSEHQHQKHTFANLMMLSRVKQQKMLENKLLARRRQSQGSHGQLDSDNTDQDPANEDVEDEQLANAQIDLQNNLAVEINTHLNQQALDLAEVIGRLQVGHARRQSQIAKTDRIIKRLHKIRETELKLEQAGGEVDRSVDVWRLRQLIDGHKEQVARLNEKLVASKEQQLAKLSEKLAQKRQSMKHSVTKRYEEENAEVTKESEKNQINLANTLMYQNKLDSRKRTALERTEAQARAQMQQQRANVNAEMQQKLDERLLEQRERFLANLTEIVSGEGAQAQEESTPTAGSAPDDGPAPDDGTAPDDVPTPENSAVLEVQPSRKQSNPTSEKPPD